MYNGEVINIKTGTITSKDIEKNGLLIMEIVVEESIKDEQKYVEVSFNTGVDDKWKDKILKLPLKFKTVSIWGARMNREPVYLGVFSHGKWGYSGMIEYQVIRNKNQMEQLDIFLSIDGTPKICN